MKKDNILVTNYGQAAIQPDNKSIHPVARATEIKTQTETQIETKPLEKQNQLGKFELFTAKNGKWHFRLKARNGEIIAISEGYDTKSGALIGIDSVRENAQTKKVIEI